MEIFTAWAEGLKAGKCMAAVEAYGRGGGGGLVPKARPIQARTKATTTTPTSRPRSSRSSRASSITASRRSLSVESNTQTSQVLPGGFVEQESGDDEVELLEEDISTNAPNQVRLKGDVLRNTDRSFVWIVNTDGCIRQILMRPRRLASHIKLNVTMLHPLHN